MLCVSLVHHAATTLGMILNRRLRDWHTADAHEDLPQATSGNHLPETTQTHGVMLGLVPSISVGPTRGLANDPREAINRDARHKGEHDTVDVAPFRLEACLLARVPGEGRGPVLREAQPHIHRSALTRTGWTPALILSLSKDAGDTAVRAATKIGLT